MRVTGFFPTSFLQTLETIFDTNFSTSWSSFKSLDFDLSKEFSTCSSIISISPSSYVSVSGKPIGSAQTPKTSEEKTSQVTEDDLPF